MIDLGVAEGGDIRAAINACQFSTGAHPISSSGSALTIPQSCCLKPRHHTCLVVRGCSNQTLECVMYIFSMCHQSLILASEMRQWINQNFPLAVYWITLQTLGHF